MTKRTSRCFTLLEIVICMAILGIVAGFTGWGINQMVVEYRFNKSVKSLVSDLRKNHLICLASRMDMELCFEKKGKDFKYFFRTDEPLPSVFSKPKRLKGVKAIRPIGDVYVLPLYSSGRIGDSPTELIFLQNETRGLTLNLKHPHNFLLKYCNLEKDGL